MKSVIYKIFLLSTILTFASCKDYLETKPVDQLTEADIFKNIANTKVALNGVYRLMYQQISSQEEDGHASMMIVSDFLGEDVVLSARGTDPFYFTHRWVDHRGAENDLPLFAYRLYFRIISNANIILEKIDSVPDATFQEKETIKAECLSLRAFGHFMLVQLFGKRYDKTLENNFDATELRSPNIALAVPIMTQHSLEGKERATVMAVYNQINKDLTDALAHFNNASKRPYKTHIDKSVALGLRARVALTQHNFEDAAAYALQAISSGFSLMSTTDYLAGFSSIINDEWMWGAQQKEEHVPTYGGFYAYMASNFNSAHTRTNPKKINKLIYDKISNTDVRKKMWCGDVNDVVNYPGVLNGNTLAPLENQVRVALMQNKFRVPNPVSRGGDIPFMRASEMYLIAAEAYQALGRDTDAQDILFELVSKRDPAYEKSTNTGNTLRDEIREQRRIELWGEGFRFFDLKRQNLALSRGVANTTGVNVTLASTTSVAVNANAWQFLIPQRELDANPLMVQNP